MPVPATSLTILSSATDSALSRTVMRPLITSKARCSGPPTAGPTTLFRIETSSAQSSPLTWKLRPLTEPDAAGATSAQVVVLPQQALSLLSDVDGCAWS